MKHKRKAALILVIAVVMALFPLGTAIANPGTIYETSAKRNITAGVTLENIVRFTVDGWYNINILRVDLSNKYVDVDAMSNSGSVKKLTSTKNLANSRGAVAAINASFFNPTGDGNGYPDGPIVETGEIISAYSEYNKYGDTMASFSIDKLNKVLYDYWKTDIALISPSGKTIQVAQHNKPSRQDYNDFTILDKKWNGTSIGSSEAYPDIVEMVVDSGNVVEIREGQPATAIPKNGYVVVTRKAGGKQLTGHFQPGDYVTLDIKTTPDWSDLKMSVTGASILVRDGKIPGKFSFDIPSISKKHPRTVIGSSQDGKQLLLVTVDGRQNSSIGMTQAETAQLMLQLGAYNALNLDGGGSTTMVARTLGDTSLTTVNSPSDGMSRLVSTAIGIFSLAPPAPLAGLIVEADDENMFVNTSRSFTVTGYDRYYNPVAVKPEDVKWSVSGVKGTFKGNVFHAQSIGEAKVTATVGNIKGAHNLSVLSAPVQLFMSEKQVKLPLNQSRSLSVSGINKNGYRAVIYPEDVKWAVKGGIGQVENGKFTATAKGTGYIDAWVGNTHAYIGISVAADTSVVKDKFETANGSYTSYPSGVKGSYKLSSEQKRSGKYSGKLGYEFTATEETQASYLVFNKDGISIDPSTSKIGVWVYNTHENSNWLRAEVRDSAGKKHMVGLTKVMDWTGWKYVEASLDGITSPSAITRLYLAKVHPVADSGSIYFDDLTVTSSGYSQIDMGKIPQDTIPVDEANKSVAYKQTADSFRFAVFGESREPKNPLEKLLMNKLADKTNRYIDAAVFVGNSAHGTAKAVKKPLLSTSTGYKSVDIKNSRLIQLDMSKQGLRVSNQGQWHWFLQQLDSFQGSNVFIFLEGSPDSFNDSLEAGLFKETLTAYRQKTHRNVWVFYKGAKNGSYTERGVKYITSAGLDVAGLTPDNTDAAKYVLVTVKGGAVTFEIKPII